MAVKLVKDDSKQIISIVETMAKKNVLVGIPSQKNHREKGAMTNSQIGYLNEKGSTAGNIPPRPWLVPGVESSTAKVIKTLKVFAKKSMDKKKDEIERGLTAAGLISQSAVKNYIVKGENFQPLSKVTLEARKSAGFKGEKPLIRTSQMLNSVTFVIRDK